MTSSNPSPFGPRGDSANVEAGTAFQPKFDANGLIPAIVSEAGSGAVLMFAHMNAEAIRQTFATGEIHFWSRSRNTLWKKGEDSGNVLKVREVRTDCDQDVLWFSASVAGQGVACHTGAKSCFYRRLVKDPGHAGGLRLEFIAAQHEPGPV